MKKLFTHTIVTFLVALKITTSLIFAAGILKSVDYLFNTNFLNETSIVILTGILYISTSVVLGTEKINKELQKLKEETL